MRKILTYAFAVMAVAMMAPVHLSAQHYIGVMGGYGSGSSRLYPPEETGTVWGLYSGGLSWKFYTSEKFVGGIQADAIWLQQGFKIFEVATIAGTDEREKVGYYQRTVNSAMVPIFWQPHVYMFKQRLRVFLNAGVTFSYVISSKEKTVDMVAQTSVENTYNMKTTRDNSFGYGLCGGGGISWIQGRLEIFAEARYYIGYSDILRNRNKYEENPLRSPLDGLQISMGAYWRVGKGGIRSRQGRPVTDEMIRGIVDPAGTVTPGEVTSEPESEGEAEEKAVPLGSGTGRTEAGEDEKKESGSRE